MDGSRREILKAGVAGAAALGAAAATVTQAAQAQTAPAAAAGGKHDLIASCWIHMGATIPFSGRMWSGHTFQSRVREVAAAGYTGIGIFHDDMAYILDNEAQGATRTDKLRWMKGVLDKHGMKNIEIEFLVNWMLPADDPRRKAEEPVRAMLLEAARSLKPRHLKIGNLGTPVSVQQANKGFLELVEEFSPTGTAVAMEILPPDPNGQTLQQALQVVKGASGKGGLFLDTWHMNNIPGITYQDIAKLRPGDVVGIELDDGILVEKDYQPYFSRIGAPGFIEMTVNCRRCLGEGNFDIVGFIKAVVASGYRGPWGNEILSEELRRLPMEVAVRHVYRRALPYLQTAIDGAPLPGPVKKYA
jgi:sugar phosphate isomerase/epimerase